MSDGWQEATLGEVADWFAGATPKATNPRFYEGGQIPWAVIGDLLADPVVETAKEITDEGLDAIGGRLAPVGSILVSMYGTIARTAVAGVPVATNQAIAWAEPRETVCEGRFLRLLVDRLQPEFAAAARGAAQKNINRGMIKSAEILLPPLDEQRRIVDLVGSIDTYIDSLETQIEATRTARSALLSELLSNSGDDWQETTLGELSAAAKPICYGVLKPGPAVDGGVPLIKIVDMVSDTVENSARIQRISHDLDQEFSRSRLNGGEVLLSIQGTVGRVALVGDSLSGANISRTIARIDTGDFEVNRFLRLWLQRAAEAGWLYAAGTTRASLNIGEIRKTVLRLPPPAEQRRIVDLVGSFDEQVSSLESQVESVRAFRSGVLSELLSGERLLDESYDVAVGV